MSCHSFYGWGVTVNSSLPTGFDVIDLQELLEVIAELMEAVSFVDTEIDRREYEAWCHAKRVLCRYRSAT